MTRIVLVALILAAILAATDQPATHWALACTGGGDPLEWAAIHADLIILGDVIEAGDAQNHAPTVTPSPRPSGTPTAGPPPALFATPGVFDFTGIGATMRVVRVIAGSAPEMLEVDGAARASLERLQRKVEAGTQILGNCGVGTFAIRYKTGARYLLFISNADPLGDFVRLAFLVEGSNLITGDELLVRGNNGTLYVKTATYHEFFEGLPTFDSGDPTYLAPGRVPLSSVLRVISFARGDPSIAPPDTGSAGLASGRW